MHHFIETALLQAYIYDRLLMQLDHKTSVFLTSRHPFVAIDHDINFLSVIIGVDEAK